MSRVRIRLDYNGRLWPAEVKTFQPASFVLGNCTFSLTHFDAALVLTVDFSKEQKAQLFRALTEYEPSSRPQWQALPVAMHPVVLKIDHDLRTAGSIADRCLRQLPQALRLPPWSFPREPANSSNRWSCARWVFDVDDLKDLQNLIEQLEPSKHSAHSNGIWIPLPNAYQGRTVFHNEENRKALGERMQQADAIPPSYALFASAQGQWESRDFAPAVAILAVAIETALKWRLTTHGDDIAGYLLENIQSPPLPKLLSCARDHADLDVPEHFQGWLEKLVRSRNEVVHRPVTKSFDPLLVGRWFSVGEAILGALAGGSPDPLVGKYVRLPFKSDAFDEGTRGVILRREETYGEDNFHILLESGVTNRFTPGAFKVEEK
jgi:hypothetical protein